MLVSKITFDLYLIIFVSKQLMVIIDSFQALKNIYLALILLIFIGSKKIIRRGTEWEIVEGLKDGQRYDKKPELFRGYLHKKRKWPLKGWHKVCFTEIIIK